MPCSPFLSLSPRGGTRDATATAVGGEPRGWRAFLFSRSSCAPVDTEGNRTEQSSRPGVWWVGMCGGWGDQRRALPPPRPISRLREVRLRCRHRMLPETPCDVGPRHCASGGGVGGGRIEESRTALAIQHRFVCITDHRLIGFDLTVCPPFPNTTNTSTLAPNPVRN